MNDRQVALEIISDVLGGGYLNLTLKKRLRGIPEQNKRFITALCFTTIENLYRIDYIIDHFTSGKRIHRIIRNILRIGVCQIMFFESVPESAAVNESVKLTEKAGKRQLKGFVNAVLRNIAQNAGSIEYPSREKDPVKYLSIFYSYPEALVRLFIDQYGENFTSELLACKKTGSDTCVRINRMKSTPPEVKNSLVSEGHRFKSGKYMKDALYVEHISSVEEMPLFKKGKIAVQSESSMLVVDAAGIEKGDTVLDVCAAPGGKTAYAAQFGSKTIVATDLHPHRVELMRQNLDRLGVKAAVTEVADATVPNPEFYECFDKVIVDAPCSALGIMYRKPDIKYAKTDIEGLYAVQRDILETCSRYVKKGGRLVYSTCSVNKCENSDIVTQFLSDNRMFREAELHPYMPESLAPRCSRGQLQLFPHIDGIDGFFIAALERKKQ